MTFKIKSESVYQYMYIYGTSSTYIHLKIIYVSLHSSLKESKITNKRKTNQIWPWESVTKYYLTRRKNPVYEKWGR